MAVKHWGLGIAFILLSIQFTSSAIPDDIRTIKAEASTDEGMDTEPAQEMCNYKIISYFLKLPQKTDFSPSAEVNKNIHRIKRICPNLERSCCSREQISNLLKQYKIGMKEMQKIKKLHEFVYTNFRLNKEEAIKPTILSYRTEEIKKECMGDDNFLSIESDLTYIFENLERANISFHFFYNFFLKFYSGVACEVCSVNAHQFISTKKNNGFSPVLKIANKNLHELILINQQLIKYLIFQSKIINILRLFECKQGVSITYLDDINLLSKSMINQSKKFETCRKQYKSMKIFSIDNPCMTIFDPYRSITELPIMKEISNVLRMTYSNLVNIFKVNFYNEKQTEFSDYTISVEFYNEVEENTGLDFELVEYEIMPEGGLDIFNNRFEPSLISEGTFLHSLECLLTLIIAFSVLI
jgi:hypothetical protein